MCGRGKDLGFIRSEMVEVGKMMGGVRGASVTAIRKKMRVFIIGFTFYTEGCCVAETVVFLFVYIIATASVVKDVTVGSTVRHDDIR